MDSASSKPVRRKSPRNVTLTVRVTAQEYEKIWDLADRKGTSIAHQLRTGIHYWMDTEITQCWEKNDDS